MQVRNSSQYFGFFIVIFCFTDAITFISMGLEKEIAVQSIMANAGVTSSVKIPDAKTSNFQLGMTRC